MKRFLLTILLSALLAACSSEPEGATMRAVYHWKTTYNPTQYEQQWLRDHRVTRLYLRVFDVDVHDIEKVAPIATTRFLQPLPDSITRNMVAPQRSPQRTGVLRNLFG